LTSKEAASPPRIFKEAATSGLRKNAGPPLGLTDAAAHSKMTRSRKVVHWSWQCPGLADDKGAML
jgi:hypothetical protein